MAGESVRRGERARVLFPIQASWLVLLLAAGAAVMPLACAAPQKPDVIPPSLQGLSFTQLRARAESPVYSDLTGRPEVYDGRLVTFSGTVSEVLSDEYEAFNMIVTTDGQHGPLKLLYALNRGAPVAVGRRVEFVGLFKDVVPVQTPLLGNVRMPEISVVSLR